MQYQLDNIFPISSTDACQRRHPITAGTSKVKPIRPGHCFLRRTYQWVQLMALLTATAGGAFAGTNLSAVDNPIIISATRLPNNASALASDVSVIKAEDLQKATGQTLDEVLTRAVGIETVRTGQAGATASFFIRGANSNHTLILIDGQRMSEAAGGTTAIQHIPLSMIDRIEIVRGSASSAYGSDAIGGVIQIFTKRGVGQPHLEAGVEAGSYRYAAQHIAFSGEVKNTAFNIAVSHSHAGGYNATTPDNTHSYHADRDGYSNKSIHARIDHHFTEEHELGVSIYATDAKIDIDNTSIDSPYQYTQHHQKLRNIRIYSQNQILPWWQSEVRMGQGRSTMHQMDDNSLSLIGQTSQNQAQWMNRFTQGAHQFLAGIEWRNEAFKSSIYHPDDRRTLSFLAGYQGIFGVHDVQINIRHDASNQYRRQHTGNIGYSFSASKQFRLFANVGHAFHAPTFMDLYYPGYSNPHLQPEKANNVEIGARYHVTDSWKVGLSAWQSRISDLIQYNNTTSTPENIKQSTLTGATLSSEAKWFTFQLQASINVQNPVDRMTGKVLPRRAKQYGTLSLQQDCGRWSWLSEMQYTTYRHDSDGTRLGGYALLNIGAEYRVNKAWGVRARLNNLLDKKYIALTGYVTPGIHGVVSVTYSGL